MPLISYLDEELMAHGEVEAVFEIYAPQPDVYYCVEHQKREITRRKMQKGLEEPLIPTMVLHLYDTRQVGFCIVITSDGYRNGRAGGDPVDPNGPLWVWFDRRHSPQSSVDMVWRYEEDPMVYGQSYKDINNISILPEKMEIRVQRKQRIGRMRADLKMLVNKTLSTNNGPNFAHDEVQGQPLSANLGAQVSSAAEEELAQTLSLGQLTTGTRVDDPNSLAISNTTSTESDLRYIIYVPFLHSYNTTMTLERTAKAFTSSMITHLPTGKTLHFEFYLPSDARYSTMSSHFTNQISTRSDMTVGARFQPRVSSEQDTPAVHARYYPCTRSERNPLPPNARVERYNTFIVILDRPDFTVSAGVLFLLTDGGKYQTQLDDVEDGSDLDYAETQVWRSAGMEEVARRLGLLTGKQIEMRRIKGRDKSKDIDTLRVDERGVSRVFDSSMTKEQKVQPHIIQ